ncbi:xylitol dehydrogenase [Mycena pura]|uniref:Xylitol dehydrogenase n=1 Tax=Mycena pura TaxID=153505 RepID=A0AAD6XYE8_9AGAR|nr:xylitol dehydrogenase [Mycena pura]
MSDNPSFVLQAIDQVAFEQRPIPDISATRFSSKSRKQSFHSPPMGAPKVHYLVHGRIGNRLVNYPMVLGHESSGIVAKVGPNVKHLKVGDRVAVEPGATCRACEACKAGRYNLCPDVIFAATPPHDGTLGRFYRVPADLAYPLPDGISLEDGAMIEPLAVGVHSVSNLGSFRAEQSIAVFGCGPIGLLCMAVAKALGARRIIAVDIVPSRLEFAKEYVATHTYLPVAANEGESKIDCSKRNADAMKKKIGVEERGLNAIDLVIDASGAEASVQTAFHVVKSGGTFVQGSVGSGLSTVTVNVGMLMPGDYPLAISLVAQGKVKLKPLVTHRFPFDQASAAFQAARTGKGEDGKGVIKAIISGPDVSIDEA